MEEVFLHVAILLSAFLGYKAEENVSKEGLRLSIPLQVQVRAHKS